MFIGLVVVGMAASTVRLVSSERPRDHLVIAGMALVTGWVIAMVTRVITAAMGKASTCPADAVMTGITLQCGDEMPRGFARCLRAIMAT